ncbi:MAG: hypothetical protein HYY56_04330 [Candidatus Omnitrophica bacterium]|nr:hypothetical protein [Candidatus Omnitrophota bacterium]
MRNDKVSIFAQKMPLQDKYAYFLHINVMFVVLSLLNLTVAGCEKGPGSIKLIIRHIENKDFAEEHVVKFGEDFFISDTDYSAKVIKFIPDFVMNEKTKKVSSRSKKPNNPAVMVRVYYKGKFLYDSWVLQKADTIHYVRKPGFYFEFIGLETK